MRCAKNNVKMEGGIRALPLEGVWEEEVYDMHAWEAPQYSRLNRLWSYATDV